MTVLSSVIASLLSLRGVRLSFVKQNLGGRRGNLFFFCHLDGSPFGFNMLNPLFEPLALFGALPQS